MATGLNGFHFGFAKIMLFHELTNFFQELPLTSAIFLHFAFRHHNSTHISTIIRGAAQLASASGLRSSTTIPTKQHHHSDEAAPPFRQSSTIIPMHQHHHSDTTILKSFEAITAETHSRDVAGTPQRPWKRTSSPVRKRFAAGVRTEIAGNPFLGTARGP